MEKIIPKGYSYVSIYKFAKLEIEKINFALCKQPAETLEHFYNCQEVKPDFLCNGGFFSMATGETIFTFIDDGDEVSINRNYLEGYGIKDNSFILDKYINNYADFISAYPVFMKNGEPVNSTIGSELNYNARRTVLGYDDNYIYIIIVELPGLNYNKIKNLLKENNIPNAINLDGGGSTRVLLKGQRETEQVYSRPVDNVVAIYLKKEEIIYRVQTGAFGLKANAEKYQSEISKLTDTINAGYKNAYIRLMNGLYKVQVGAFSQKKNAEKVVKDLKAKGYDSFITS